MSANQSLASHQAFLSEVLKTWPCSKLPLPKDGKILCVPGDAKVPDAIQLLLIHGYSAAPVTNPKPSGDAWQQKYMGVFDAAGVVLSIMKVLQPLKEEHPDPTNLGLFLKHAFKEARIMNMAVADVLGMNRCCNKFVAVKETTSVLDLILVMDDTMVHRAAILNAENELVNFVTQSHIVQKLSESMHLLDDLVCAPLSSLGLANEKRVVQVDSKTKVAEAFNLIDKEGVPALAVTGEFGVLMGVLSVSDVHTLLHKNKLYRLLHSSVAEFIGACREGQVDTTHPSITCRMDEPLGLVMDRLCKTGVHRLFLVDADRQLLSVVSYTDILRVLIKRPDDWSSRHFVLDFDVHIVKKA